MTTMTFNQWRQNADMPRVDAFGNWYDAETGLYFKEPERIPVYRQLLQYWGKRVLVSENKPGWITLYIDDSRLHRLAEKTIKADRFDMPADNNAAVEWACQMCGIGLKD